MKFNCDFKAARIDLDRYAKVLDKHLRQEIAAALDKWLEAVLLEIPVWSGASQATFVKLAGLIGQNIPIAPVAMYHGRPVDRIGEGASAGMGSMELGRKGRYTFTYSTSLPWLIWNEYHNANVEPDETLFAQVLKEGPYNFQARGAAAFLHFADRVQLPAVPPFVDSIEVK